VVTRTFTARAGISRLTAIMNAGTPAPTSVVAGMHCAAVATVYILRLTPRAAGGPSVVVTLGACPHAYDITVNGKQQPLLGRRQAAHGGGRPGGSALTCQAG
jgi:hypothetical protein